MGNYYCKLINAMHEFTPPSVHQNLQSLNKQANSLSSFVSDMSWAYAMLLTTPLVVTVGLSLTIPLSLIGEMIQYQQFSSWIYWVGAAIVLLSFVFINHESHEDDESVRDRRREEAAAASGSSSIAV